MRLARRATLALPFLATAARAQSWPARPIRIIVSYPPGGATDVVTRKVAELIGPILGTPCVVENKAGGSGTIGTSEVARATPDGYTLLGNDNSYAMLPYVFARLPFDHARDLLPVTVSNFAPVVLTVQASSRFRTLAQLVAEAKAKPGVVNYGTGGVGSSLHFAAEAFQQAAGVELFHIPFKGAGEATLNLLNGTVDMVMGSLPSAMANLKAGTIRALAVCGAERSAAVPEVPLFQQAGVSGFNMVNWTGLAAPKGTPDAVVLRLQQAVVQALATPAMQGFLSAQGATPGGLTPEAFAALIAAETALWRDVAAKAGITPQ
jgi:tripartite-type tricarboxylate transporter receptor subunit TctC